MRDWIEPFLFALVIAACLFFLAYFILKATVYP